MMNYHVIITAAAILHPFLAIMFCSGQGSTDPCQTSDMCGEFGVCDSRGSPICSCPKGFKARSDGCERRVPLDCDGRNGGDGFLTLQILTLSSRSELWLGSQAECEPRCLRNCSCLAYGFYGLAGCRFYTHPLLDLIRFSSGSNVNIRVLKSELENNEGSKSKKTVVIVVLFVGFVVLSTFVFFSWELIAKRRGKEEGKQLGATNGGVAEDELSEGNLEELPLFKMEVLTNATNNFSEAKKLGSGGFGPVYKGEMENGREIAVKVLAQTSRQGMKEFVNEVMLISKLQHKNLVRLLGCCVENKQTILVYEYMPNKSLDFFLFDSSIEIVLDWSKYFKIIRGVSRGLLYLHKDSRLKIIHRDLKPSNILLDDEWNPKISDFGMARIFGTNQDHVQTVRVVGT